MGQVFRAQDTLLDVPVALKVVRPELAQDPRFRRRFDLEVRISARFSHPRIVPLHDHGETESGVPYLGLAYADLGSFAALRTDPAPWDDLRRLVLELLDALAHLHARDVLHRDLKPENVLLHEGEDGHRHVWLADLGLARVARDVMQHQGRTEGTPGYMAPEQALGQPREYGPWTDLFGVGVVIWELVTGDLPFAVDQSPDATCLPPLVPRMAVPEGLEVLLANLLHPDPLARYDLAADLRTELDGLVDPLAPAGVALPPARPGTVCPGIVAPLGEDITEVDGSETHPFDLGDPDREAPTRPVWNRPLPSSMPALAPGNVAQGEAARASLRLFALREPPVVARDAVQQELWDHARGVADDGIGRVVLLVGGAGTGKSRILSDLASHLEAGGWSEAVRLSYQREATELDGYAGAARILIRPWNEERASLVSRLRRRLGRERGRVDAHVQQEAEALARWCGFLDPGEAPVPFGLGLREVYRHLEARQWRGMSTLFLDDVHWATAEGDGIAIPATLLQRWGEGLHQPLLVLVSLRTEDLAAHPDLADQVDALVGHGAHRIDLPALDRAGIEAMLGQTLRLTDALVDRLGGLCEGNPLFARLLLLEWAECGWLVDEGGLRFGLRPGIDPLETLAPDASALFRQRVAHLAEATGTPDRLQDAVHLAALAGRSLPVPLAASFVDQDLIEIGQGAGLWVLHDDRLTFESRLLHQAVREEAEERGDRQALHHRLGQAWAAYAAATGAATHLEAGRHAAAAGDAADAVPWLLEAAQRAWDTGQSVHLDHATHWLQTAVADGGLSIEVQGWAALWRGRSLWSRGDTQPAADLLHEARRCFEAEARGPGLVDTLVALGEVELNAGDLDAADIVLSEALERARLMETRSAEARAIAGKAWLEQKRRNFQGADILFTRVLARCVQLADLKGAGEALLGQAYVARRTGAFDEAAELYDEAAETFADGDHLVGVAQSRIGLATVERQRQQWDRSEVLSREAVERCEELGAIQLLGQARLGLAELSRLTGDLDRAEAVYLEHARIAEGSGAFEEALFAALGLAHVALERDDLDGAYTHTSHAATLLDRVPGHWLWASYRLVVATLLAQRGDHTETWRWLWSASELGLADTVDLDTARGLETICRIAKERGWANVIRVAAKLATDQLDQLGLHDRRAAVQRDLTSALE